jgi:hypothetical protein
MGEGNCYLGRVRCTGARCSWFENNYVDGPSRMDFPCSSGDGSRTVFMNVIGLMYSYVGQ